MPKRIKNQDSSRGSGDFVGTTKIRTGGAWHPLVRLGQPPINPMMIGFSGGRSTSDDVTSSQIMQITMNDDDIDYFREIENDPPYDLARTFIKDNIDYFREIENDPPYDLARTFIKESLVEMYLDDSCCHFVEDDNGDNDTDLSERRKTKRRKKQKRKQENEASTTAGVSGYSLPLGMSNKKKTDEPSWYAYARALGVDPGKQSKKKSVKRRKKH